VRATTSSSPCSARPSATTRFAGNATLASAGVDRTTWIGDLIATWRGTWDATHARAQVALHHSARSESAHDPTAAAIPQLLSTYIPKTLPDDKMLAAACDDGSLSDPARTIANCPVPFGYFASAGAGPLTSVVGDRLSITADLTQRIGGHVVRAGVTDEVSELVTTSAFTGGEQDRTLLVGELSQRRFYTGICGDAPQDRCDYTSSSELTYRTLYGAAYVEDTWSPVPGLAFDAGLRWELMWVGARLQFSNQLAPRLGVVWDPLGSGRSRLVGELRPDVRDAAGGARADADPARRHGR